MAAPKLYRVIMPAGDLVKSVAYYARVLDMPGEQVSGGRHYFDCGGVILACVQQREGAQPNVDHVYFSVPDLNAAYVRVQSAAAEGFGAVVEGEMGEIKERPWGELSFYGSDPFGNPVCFVEEGTEFTGGRFVP